MNTITDVGNLGAFNPPCRQILKQCLFLKAKHKFLGVFLDPVLLLEVKMMAVAQDAFAQLLPVLVLVKPILIPYYQEGHTEICPRTIKLYLLLISAHRGTNCIVQKPTLHPKERDNL